MDQGLSTEHVVFASVTFGAMLSLILFLVYNLYSCRTNSPSYNLLDCHESVKDIYLVCQFGSRRVTSSILQLDYFKMNCRPNP